MALGRLVKVVFWTFFCSSIHCCQHTACCRVKSTWPNFSTLYTMRFSLSIFVCISPLCVFVAPFLCVSFLSWCMWFFSVSVCNFFSLWSTIVCVCVSQPLYVSPVTFLSKQQPVQFGSLQQNRTDVKNFVLLVVATVNYRCHSLQTILFIKSCFEWKKWVK